MLSKAIPTQVSLAKFLSLTLTALVVLLTISLASADDAAKAESRPPQRLLAYYPDWAKYQTPPYTAEKIPYNKVTHIR